MELTFPRGSLTAELRAEIDEFYGSIFGWTFLDTQVIGQLAHYCRVDDDHFILLAESDTPISSPGYDHLGLLVDSRDEVDRLLAACKQWQTTDDRVRIKEYEDLVTPSVTVHAFYVKFLLPIWFDIQVLERSSVAAAS
jgi:hypothetical protein